MNATGQLVPVLPESAPFSPEQRAYLNGFLAGLFSHAAPNPVASVQAPGHPSEPLAILFGSQTGNAEKLAKRVAKVAAQQGFAPVVHDLARFRPEQLASQRNLLIVTSTYGDGEPPDNARSFWQVLASEAAPKLPALRFSVCALGDSNYHRFCHFGKLLDARLERLGASRIHAREDCDVEFEEPFARWLASSVPALASGNNQVQVQAEPVPPPIGGDQARPAAGRTANPISARLLTNRRLTDAGSEKDVRHLELGLGTSDVVYEVGDALEVWPTNCPELVAELLDRLGSDGEDAVPGRDGVPTPLRVALLSHYEITRIPLPFLKWVAEQSGDSALWKLTDPEANGDLTAFLRGREIIDLILAHPRVFQNPESFVARLRKLQPRSYSIASSLKARPGEVHLTVGVVRYEALGRRRKGVCSTFLAERVAGDQPVPVHVRTNPVFRLPTGDRPIIMVGPGTGIAPFRGFLQERGAVGATGKNWLFFGEQRSRTDYLYREEIDSWQRQGLLARLDLAWSRDQSDKIYVQHRMLEHARNLFDWLENGGSFFVCGDARRMAKDVDVALHRTIELGGRRTAEQAAEYVSRLVEERRYLRDVY